MGVESQKIISYIADIKPYLRDLSKLENANAKTANKIARDFNRNLKSIGSPLSKVSATETKQLKDGFENLANTTTKVSKNFTDAKGNIGKFTETIRVNEKGVAKTTRTYQDMDKNTVSLGANLKRLATRAALTIPLWLALRGAITGVINTVKNGFKDIVAFDRALQKLRKNLQGSPQEIARNFEVAKRTIREFSIESGKSTEDITKAIQRFATVGFDFETAMSAGLDATRLSVLLFGEAEETANAFSRGLRVLVSDVNNTEKSQKEIAGALALTSELYETNAFELKELSGGLEKFAGTAKSMNFTIEETLTLLGALSTRGLNAERSGRLLRTSTQKLEQNLSKVSKVLGVEVNPEMDRTFDVFVRVTNAIAKLQNEAGTISPAVSEAISELFGGVRGGETVRDLIADMANVNKAFEKFTNFKPDINKFRKDFEDMNDTAFRQVEIMGNLNKEIGKTFVTGLTGGKDFVDSLKIINQFLKDNVETAKTFGKVLNTTFKAGKLIGKVALFGTGIAVPKFDKEAKKAVREIKEQISKGLRGELSDTDLKKLVVKIARSNLKKIKVSEQTLSDLGTQLSKQLNDNFKQSPVEVNAKAEIKAVQFEGKRQELAELVVQSELERLRSLGASNVELLKAENTYNKLLNVQREEADILQNKLDLERAIAEEKRLQSRLGSESIKLFKIAQQQGVDVAKRIGDVLAGDTSFSTFVRRGGKDLEIFKKQFASIFEQQQALAFFQGGRVPGAPALRGGAGVSIQEEAIRRPIDQFQLQRTASGAGVLPTRTQAVNNVQQTNNITNNFTIGTDDPEKVSEAVIKSMANPKVKQEFYKLITGSNQARIF